MLNNYITIHFKKQIKKPMVSLGCTIPGVAGFTYLNVTDSRCLSSTSKSIDLVVPPSVEAVFQEAYDKITDNQELDQVRAFKAIEEEDKIEYEIYSKEIYDSSQFVAEKVEKEISSKSNSVINIKNEQNKINIRIVRKEGINLLDAVNPSLSGTKEEENALVVVNSITSQTKKLVNTYPDKEERSAFNEKSSFLFNLEKPNKNDFNLSQIFDQWDTFFSIGKELSVKGFQQLLDNSIIESFKVSRKNFEDHTEVPFSSFVRKALGLTVQKLRIKSNIHKKNKKTKYPIDYDRLIYIIELKEEELSNEIASTFSTILFYSNSTSMVPFHHFASNLAKKIEIVIFKDFKWTDFGGKPYSKVPTILNFFIKNFTESLIEVCPFLDFQSFSYIKKNKKTFYHTIQDSYYFVILDRSIDGEKKRYNWSSFRFIESRFLPRLTPFNKWEFNTGSKEGGFILRIPYYQGAFSVKLAPTPKYSISFEIFDKEGVVLDSINQYQEQPWLICEESLSAIINSGQELSGHFFKNDSDKLPYFGSSEHVSNYIKPFLYFCFKKNNNGYVNINTLYLFIDAYNIIISRRYLIYKRAAHWLNLFSHQSKIRDQAFLYLMANIDFRGRDACPGFLHPLNSRLGRLVIYPVTQNSFLEKELCNKKASYAALYLCSYIYNIVFPKKLFNYHSICNEILGPERVPHDYRNQSKYSYYLKDASILFPYSFKIRKWMDSNIGSVNGQENYLKFISIYERLTNPQSLIISLDATASVLQILVMITQSSDLLEFVNLKGDPETKRSAQILKKDREGFFISHVDPYTSFIKLPSKEEIQKDFRLEKITRDVIKHYIITKIYGIGKSSFVLNLIDKFDITNNQAFACYIYLNQQFKNQFQFQLDFLDFLKNKQVNQGTFSSFKGVTLDIPFKCRYKYNQTSNARPRLEINKVKCQPSFRYSNNSLANVVKHSTSFQANLVHSIDAYIKVEIVREFRKKKIGICVIHDCFIVAPHVAPYVISYYNETLLKVADIFQEDLEAFNKAQNQNFSGFTKEDRQLIILARYSLSSF